MNGSYGKTAQMRKYFLKKWKKEVFLRQYEGEKYHGLDTFRVKGNSGESDVEQDIGKERTCIKQACTGCINEDLFGIKKEQWEKETGGVDNAFT